MRADTADRRYTRERIATEEVALMSRRAAFAPLKREHAI